MVSLDKRVGFDVDDAQKLDAVFKKEKPDIVFHLAGPMDLRKPTTGAVPLKDADFLSRIKIILSACQKHRVKKIVFASSGGAIYENALQLPTSEEYSPHPKSAYGLANLAIEEYIKKSGMPFAIARLSNVYGPDQWESGFIPAMIMKMLKQEKPVIFGDGKQTRDFIYIKDAVEALILLAQKGKNEIYNVGSGREIGLNEVFGLIKTIAGAKTSPVYKSAQSPGAERSVVDIKKIQKELGFQPKTGMKEGLLKTIEYYQHAQS